MAVLSIAGQENISKVILVNTNEQTEKHPRATYMTTAMKGMIKVLIVTEKGIYVKDLMVK
ncbi:MAG: hypothetical protein K0R51_1113 [Cytophagaceae bacterium]|jgi:hypothetical protein|nr:hypothetical protein [Cytophagaceae bacterium]